MAQSDLIHITYTSSLKGVIHMIWASTCNLGSCVKHSASCEALTEDPLISGRTLYHNGTELLWSYLKKMFFLSKQKEQTLMRLCILWHLHCLRVYPFTAGSSLYISS